MIATPTFVTAQGAMEYHTESKDNYYQKEGSLGEWQGSLARDLGFAKGLVNEVSKEDLENALWGKDASGKQLVQARLDENGDRKRAGMDVTFNAPKSVSVAVELAKASGREDIALALIKAHEDATAKILNKFEKIVESRETHNRNTETVTTSKALIAKFTHDISRPVTNVETGQTTVDPSLHTHALIMNVTQLKDGSYRTIESKKIMENYMRLGQQYRSELAANLKEIGYSIEVTDQNHGFFELANYNKELNEEFSKRSEAINDPELIANLKEKYPNATDSEIKQLATYATREFKGSIDRKQTRQDNLERAKSITNDLDKVFMPDIDLGNLQAQKSNEEIASQVVKTAVSALTEGESVFEKNTILDIAGKLSLKEQISISTLEKAIDDELKSKDDAKLINFKDEYYTTKEIVESERKILDIISEKNQIKQIMSKTTSDNEVERYSNLIVQNGGYGMTDGQKEGAKLILGGTNMIVGIQGDAGVGKTTMLKAVNELAKDSNTKILGLSYTGKAASEIEEKTKYISELSMKEAGITSQTVSSFIAQVKDGKVSHDDFKDAKIIVDEASMLGVKDAKVLVEFAKESNAQLILIGDKKQFKAIGAGDPFTLLQNSKNGEVIEMNQVLRQKTQLLKDAVKSVNSFDTDKAIDLLDEHKKVEEFDKNIMKERVIELFFEKAKGGEEDEPIVLVNTNEAKDDLNQAIRNKKQQYGQVQKEEKEFTVRESARLSPVKKFLAQNYKAGQKVFLQGDIADLKKGSEHTILGVDLKENTIDLKDKDGNNNTVNLSTYGKNLQVYDEKRMKFSIGDKIVFEKNDKKLGVEKVENGLVGKIKNIDDKGNLSIFADNGKIINFNVANYNYFNLGYAATGHKLQGQTSKNVIAMLDSKIQNFNSFYVAVTRAEENFMIITDDKETLKQMIAIEQVKYNHEDFETQLLKSEKDKESLKNKRVQNASKKYEKTEERDNDEMVEKLVDDAIQNNEIAKASQILTDTEKNISEKSKEKITNKIDKKASSQASKNYSKITKDEIEKLRKMTSEELSSTNPEAVLDKLGINYRVKSGRYEFKSRVEKTASSNIFLGDDGWKFHDFGSGEGGTIVNLVMSVTDMSFVEAQRFSIETLGIKDHVQERFDEIKKSNSPRKPFKIKEEHIRKIEKLRIENEKFSKENHSKSKILSFDKIEENSKEHEYLKSRGIEKIPKFLFKITGEVENSSGKKFKTSGVGVIFGDMSKPIDSEKVDGDIHFLIPKLKEDGKIQKTQTFGEKSITIIPNKNSHIISVFESKMCYSAAVSQDENIEKTTIIIANSTALSSKVADEINRNKTDKMLVQFYQQNDKSGKDFMNKVVAKANISNGKKISYKHDEKDKDINDLVKNKVALRDRKIDISRAGNSKENESSKSR